MLLVPPFTHRFFFLFFFFFWFIFLLGCLLLHCAHPASCRTNSNPCRCNCWKRGKRRRKKRKRMRWKIKDKARTMQNKKNPPSEGGIETDPPANTFLTKRPMVRLYFYGTMIVLPSGCIYFLPCCC
ncbi:MAG: hypothetical protein JOS17DRAFT_99033 [Linnemannia elongata]|nr:MAG: hypothetical protein JOS17DRAFT_99033 [Linnemannia elongata]